MLWGLNNYVGGTPGNKSLAKKAWLGIHPPGGPGVHSPGLELRLVPCSRSDLCLPSTGPGREWLMVLCCAFDLSRAVQSQVCQPPGR